MNTWRYNSRQILSFSLLSSTAWPKGSGAAQVDGPGERKTTRADTVRLHR